MKRYRFSIKDLARGGKEPLRETSLRFHSASKIAPLHSKIKTTTPLKTTRALNSRQIKLEVPKWADGRFTF
jgi:hypothetical protein